MVQTLLEFEETIDAVKSIQETFQKQFLDFIVYMNTGFSYFSYLGPICISIGGFTLLILIIILIFFSKRIKNELHWTSCPTHCCNCIFGFITFILTCFALLFVLINYSVESICEFSTKVIETPLISDEVKPYFQQKYQGLLDSSCFSDKPNQAADVFYLNDDAKIDNFKEIDEFLDGFSYYDNFLKVIPADKSINSINTTVNGWTPFKTGLKDNFDNAQGNINNDQIYSNN